MIEDCFRISVDWSLVLTTADRTIISLRRTANNEHELVHYQLIT